MDIVSIQKKTSKVPLKNQFTFDQPNPQTASPTETIQFTKDGNKIKGILEDNNINHGTIEYKNGDFFEGDIKQGKAHGNGKMVYHNKNKYQGEFLNDLRHGKGQLTFVNASFYSGEFANDHFHGKGVFRFSNGNVYKGIYAIVDNYRELRKWDEEWLWGTNFQ